jgi:hypothetical protein
VSGFSSASSVPSAVNWLEVLPQNRRSPRTFSANTDGSRGMQPIKAKPVFRQDGPDRQDGGVLVDLIETNASPCRPQTESILSIRFILSSVCRHLPVISGPSKRPLDPFTRP